MSATNISVYGVGNFGYALLKHLSNKPSDNYKIRAYDYDPIIIKSLQSKQRHPYLFKDQKISDEVLFVDEPGKLFAECDILILAVSSSVTHEVLQTIKLHIDDGLVIVNTSKALDFQSGKRLSEVVSEELDSIRYTYALFAGGTIARDLFAQEPLGADIACTDKESLAQLQTVFESDNLFINTTTDLLGVEYAAALKNIVSVIAGIVKGLGFSYGSETYIISHTADLVGKACVTKLGAQPETFSIGSQCWGNDLWMSCTGGTRNREFGELLGRGISVDAALNKMKQQHKTVEAMNTIKILKTLPGLGEIPILALLHNLLIDKSIDIQRFRESLIADI